VLAATNCGIILVVTELIGIFLENLIISSENFVVLSSKSYFLDFSSSLVIGI